MPFLFALAFAMGAFSTHAENYTVTNVVVEPLTDAHWTQGAPYNDYSPKGTTAFTSGWEAGCVAIAAAQELYYWQWPWSLGAVRETSHPVLNESPLAIRFDGNVPFDWDNMPDSFSSGETLAQKHAVAHLVLACQSLVQMQFVNAGGEAKKNLPGTMEWFEFGQQIDPKSGNDAIAALRADFEFGSPVQTGINFKGYGGHEVVGLGFATTSGDEEKNLIWLNLGWGGGSDGWYDLSETAASETIIKSVQLGFRPIKSVQIEPVAPVSGSSVMLKWHLPNCYTNKIDSFTVANKKLGTTTTTWSDDFSTAKGRSNNANEVRIVNGALKAWDGTASGMYIWDEVFVPTADSVMTYDVGSSYMSGMSVRFEAKVDGEWQTINTVAVNGGKEVNYYNWGTTTAADPVSLASLAGKPIQLRYVVEYTKGSIFSSDDASVKIDNLSISNVKTFDTVVGSENVLDNVRGMMLTDLEQGMTYAFSVTPVMSDGSAAVTQTATTTIGTPAASPVIGTVTMSPRGTDLMQEGFYADIAMGWNIINVACQHVETLEAFPSHQSVLPQSKVEVIDNSNGSFSINIDATEVAAKWAGQRMILTLKATNETGETTYKDLELRLVASGVPENVPGGKVWTGADGFFGENYTAKWANNDLPSNGDKATFYVADGDYGAMMNLNLTSATELGYVNATGLGQLTISGSSSETLTIDTLKNDVQVEVNSTKLKVKKAVPSANIVIDSGSSLDCEIDQSRSSYLKKVQNGYTSALADSALWKGTVVFDNYSAKWLNPNDYGNIESKVRLSGVSGYLASSNPTFNPTIELVDAESAPALNWNDGSGTSTATFKKIIGDGTFKVSAISTTAKNEKIIINDTDAFTGSFDIASKTVAIGTTLGTTANNGRMDVNNGNDVTIAAGKTWNIGGGMYLGGNQTITVNGTLNGAITAEGTGTTLALKPTSAVTAASLNMANNTISIEKSADAASAVTVSGAVNLTDATVTLNLTGEPGNAVALMSAGSFTGVESASLTGLDDYELAVEEGVLYAKSLNPSYDGPEPIATWVSWEFEDEASKHNGYALVTNAFNTINADGNIEIGSSATIGTTIALPEDTYTQATILVKFELPKAGAPVANASIAGVISSDNNPIGAYCATADGTSLTGYWLNANGAIQLGNSGYNFSTTPVTSAGEGYMLLAYCSELANPMSKGTALYTGSSIENLTGGNVSGLQWKGNKLNKFAIGGPVADGNAKPWAGMVVKGVALFVDKWLTPSDIVGYEFPEPEEPIRTDVHFKSGFWGEGGENPFVVVLDNDNPTTVLEGETVIIDDKSSGVDTIYFGSTLPVNANKIKVSRDVIFSSGANNPSMLDGATITVDEGVTLTFKRQWNNIVLGNVVINGPGTVKFDHNDGTITIGGALSGTAVVTVETGKQISVASDGAIANTIAGDGTVAYASMPSVPMPLASGWTGTVELPQFQANGQVLANYCNDNSKLKLDGITSGYLHWTDFSLNAEVILAGNFVLTDMSQRNYAFNKISGSGNISLSHGKYELTGFTIGELAEGYQGAVTNNMSSTKIVINYLMLPANTSVTPGSKVLAIGGTQADGVKVTNVKVGGVLQKVQLERRYKGEAGDGLYVKAQIETEGEGENKVITVVTDKSAVEMLVEEGFAGTIVVSPIVTSIYTGSVNVSADQVKVKYGDNDITGAFNISDSLEIALNADGSVEDVAVKPALDEESSIEDGSFTVKTIPGLWYGVKYGDALSGGDIGGTVGNTTPEQATSFGDKELTAPKDGTLKFYRVRVGARRSDLE
jgi:hypothetical protein